MNKKRIVIATLVVLIINLIVQNLFINVSYSALYASRGDYIPVANIEYDAENNESVFPESYREDLKKLKEAHPNWTFMAVYTNLDWSQTLLHESYDINPGISLVPMSFANVWKKDEKNYFQDGSWVIASKQAVAYALDPRNYLDEKYIFQFESLSCVEGVHTLEAVEKTLVGTDLETKYTENEAGEKVIKYPTYRNVNNVEITMDKTYAKIIYEAGIESGVSPIHIATRIRQETGGTLTNGSICGTNENYVGYYNFFNIGATPGSDGNSAVTNGLITAKNNGWDSPEKSIKAGALTLYNSYIKYGQDTIYFQKFDVSNSKGNATMLYACQYMTNILAPSSESKITFEAYSKLGLIDSSFVFYIPVYENRPLEKAPKPGESADQTELEKDKEEEKEIKVTAIATEKTNYNIAVGKTVDVSIVILPQNATNKEYEASSSNEDVVTVNGNKITAVKVGDAKVIFKSKDGGYVTVVNVNVKEKEEIEIDEEKLTITENNNITGILPETKLKDILEGVKTTDNLKIEARSMNGDILKDDSLVGTGTNIIISSEDGSVLAKYIVIVKSDVNGDSKVTASDYVLIKNYIMGTSKFDEYQKLGADVNLDSKVTASDYVLIKNHIMGVNKLY